jgi:REP element-mobilizing transposase RayT
MVRGINRQDIFQNDEDKGVYLKRIAKYKDECGFKIYAYCFMCNHIHLLIKEGEKSISEAMKKIGTSYVYWYNLKHNRTGHLFQDRFRSEVVENDAYLLTVAKNIHQNPVKIGLSIDVWTKL